MQKKKIQKTKRQLIADALIKSGTKGMTMCQLESRFRNCCVSKILSDLMRAKYSKYGCLIKSFWQQPKKGKRKTKKYFAVKKCIVEISRK